MWAWLALFSCLMAILFWEVIKLLIGNWLGTAEYSYGIIMPFVSGFFIWQKNQLLSDYAYTGSWLGVCLLFLGISIYIFGELSALQILIEYAFLIAILGGVLALVGEPVFKKIWIPLFFLFFTIPLPSFLYQGLSAKLQLFSSSIGVAFIRFWGISVFLEGNVIDLGSMKLQVAEACSGLTYLFPLISVAFICAYIYHAEFWKRAIVFGSSIPITILMNSFRIGMIGVLVEYWGKSMAEGFLHDFEGWVVFMGCTLLIVIEVWLLTKIGPHPKPFGEVFGLFMVEPHSANTKFQPRMLPSPYWVAMTLLLAAIWVSPFLKQREESIPPRTEFHDFPMRLGQWSGSRQVLDQITIDALKFEDYLLADYLKDGDSTPVNVYSAFYASQRKGESIHSPRSCLPGGGWQIITLERIWINTADEAPFLVNRALIRKGDSRQLVYYWFRQGGRNIADEYQAKWYVFWNGLTRNRTDGALIRLSIAIPKNEETINMENRLKDLLKYVIQKIPKYLPE